MSWSDDTRCLFCDGKLPLYRKLAQGQFCSKAHQEAYWKEQEQLAVETLHRTHDALQAYKPSVSIESILGPTPVAKAAPAPIYVDTDPPMAGLLSQTERMGAVRTAVVPMVVSATGEYEAASIIVVPEWASEPLPVEAEARPEADYSEIETGLLHLNGFDAQDVPVTTLEAAGNESNPFAPALPSLPLGTTVQDLALVGHVEMAHFEPAIFPVSLSATNQLEFASSAVTMPARKVTPCDDALERIESEVFPLAEQPIALAAPLPSHRAVRMVQSETELAAISGFELEHPVSSGRAAASFEPAFIGQLAGIRAPKSAEPLRSAVCGDVRPVEVSLSSVAMGRPELPLATMDPGMAGTLRIAAPAAKDHVAGAMANPACLDLPLAAPRVPVAKFSARPLAIRAFADRTFRLDLAERIQPSAGSLRPRAALALAPVERDPQLPRLRLDVVDPNSPFQGQRSRIPGPQLLAAAVNFWQQAPRDLKVLLFAVPLAVGLAFHPSLPKVSVQGPQAVSGDASGSFQNVVSTQVSGLKKAIADRAAIGLDENFRQGLDNWMGNNGSTAEWSFDQAGFVQPGRVALYQPSLGLKDYELQFLGAIDKGALSWVVRAADFENYYVVKLAVTKPGVIPQLGIIRYAVINGQPVDRVDTPVALNTRVDSLYRVSMTMDGDHYSLSVQGQVIDAWKEDRLKHGGVGFFTNRGEQSRIGWVQITHQYDMLGRLFAYLAP